MRLAIGSAKCLEAAEPSWHPTGMARRRKRKNEADLGVAFGILGLLAVLVFLAAHPGIFTGIVVTILSVAALWVGWRIYRRRSDRRRVVEWHRYQAEAQQELKDWLAMTPTEFEYAVAQLYADFGHLNVQRIGRSGDRAVDVTFTDAGDGGFSVIQCKRYAPGQRVGSRDIQAFIGMAFAEYEAVHAIFVTTADYTPEAKALAGRHGIDLIDGLDLVEMSRARLGTGEDTSP